MPKKQRRSTPPSANASCFDMLPDDELWVLFRVLDVQSLLKLAVCASKFRTKIHSWKSLWNQLELPFTDTHQFLRGAEPTIPNLMELQRVRSATQRLSVVRWTRPKLRHGSVLRAQEGHAATLVADRFVVLVCGFGMGVRNDVHVMDAWEWPEARWMYTKTMGAVALSTYGHSIVAIDDTSTLLFGGMTSGGYVGECNRARVLSIAHISPTDPPQVGVDAGYEVIATYTGVSSTGILPTPRGYHSAVLVPFNGAPHMFVFGGIQNGRSIAQLEIFNLQTSTWSIPHTCGLEPSPRFGHSCVYHAQSDSLIFMGGSNGSDVLRDGDDLQTVHILKFDRATDGRLFDELIWSQPDAWQLPLQTTLGRCHSASLVGNNVVIFGGHPQLTNELSILNIPTMQIRHGYAVGHKPSPRLSSVGVACGRYMLVHGGWNGRELADMKLLDLGYETSDRYLEKRCIFTQSAQSAPTRSCRTSTTNHQSDEFVDWSSDEEDEHEEDVDMVFSDQTTFLTHMLRVLTDPQDRNTHHAPEEPRRPQSTTQDCTQS